MFIEPSRCTSARLASGSARNDCIYNKMNLIVHSSKRLSMFVRNLANHWWTPDLIHISLPRQPHIWHGCTKCVVLTWCCCSYVSQQTAARVYNVYAFKPWTKRHAGLQSRSAEKQGLDYQCNHSWSTSAVERMWADLLCNLTWSKSGLPNGVAVYVAVQQPANHYW